MVHIRFAQIPRWQPRRRLGLPARLLVGVLALGIGVAVALLAVLSGVVFLAATLLMRGWRAVAGPRRRPAAPASAPVKPRASTTDRREDATDVPFKELP